MDTDQRYKTSSIQDGKTLQPKSLYRDSSNNSKDSHIAMKTTNNKSCSNDAEGKTQNDNQTERGAHDPGHPTSYAETMMHLFKGNVGPGLYALGDAFKNGGIIAAPIMTLILGIICVHSQHILITCSNKIKEINGLPSPPDFAKTVELSFENGPPKLRKFSKLMRSLVNIFLCVTQLGFCCVYFVFITSNMKLILDYYGLIINSHLIMAIILVPIALPSLITNLKLLAPFSTVANICMVAGIGITIYFCVQDLPSPKERRYIGNLEQLPLYFGTAVYAFEGISLVLPLQNSMKIPSNFARPAGVLNCGMFVITTLFISVGFLGYLKFGEDVEGSLTLNLPQDNKLAQAVQIMISVSVLLGYALQFFVAIEIMWPVVKQNFNIQRHPLFFGQLFRIFWILITFAIAEIVPKLSVFISLIGAVCSTSLALVFPPVIELITAWGTSEGPSVFVLVKNIIILSVAALGFATGGYESIRAFVREFGS